LGKQIDDLAKKNNLDPMALFKEGKALAGNLGNVKDFAVKVTALCQQIV